MLGNMLGVVLGTVRLYFFRPDRKKFTLFPYKHSFYDLKFSFTRDRGVKGRVRRRAHTAYPVPVFALPRDILSKTSDMLLPLFWHRKKKISLDKTPTLK